MAGPIIAGIGTGLGALGSLFGGGKSQKPPKTAKDLLPLRRENIDLIMYMLGMTDPNRPWAHQGPAPGPTPGATGRDGGSYGMDGMIPGTTSRGMVQSPSNPGRGSDWGPTYGIEQQQQMQTPTAVFGPATMTPGGDKPWMVAPSQGNGPLTTWLQGGTPPPVKPSYAQGGVARAGYAGGGMARGPGGPHSDKITAKLSNGEGVLTAEAVHRLGGPAGIALINALSGGGAPIPHFAGGGVAAQMWGPNNSPQQQQPSYGAGGATTRRAAQPYGPTPTPQGPTQVGTGGGASQFPGGLNPIMMPPSLPNVGPSKPAPPPTWNGTQLWADSNAPATNGVLQRAESILGPLGAPTTALQRQSINGMSQFMNSNPYEQSNNALAQIMGSQGQNYFGGAQDAFNQVQNANYFGGAQNQANQVAGANYFGGAQRGYNQLQNGQYFNNAENSFNRLENYNPFQPAQTALEGMFQTNPGEGVMNALHPLYERALAEANQTGGRFGSANAIMRSRAVDDYSLQMQRAMQEGVNQQIAGAGVYGNMGNSLIGARTAAGQGLLGVGQGRMQQQATAAGGLMDVGQGRLQQGLGAGNLLLGVGQGQLQQGLGAANGLLGVGQGRSSYGLGLMGNQIAAANQLAQNQNGYMGNLASMYGIGQQQAEQEAIRQRDAQNFYLSQLGISQQASMSPYG